MKIALVAPAGVSNHAMHTIPALMWLVGRLATRHTVKVYLLHRAAAPTRVNVLGAEVVNEGGALRHLRVIQAICAEHRRAPFDLVHSICRARRSARGPDDRTAAPRSSRGR
jgi:hypothetical protein